MAFFDWFLTLFPFIPLPLIALFTAFVALMMAILIFKLIAFIMDVFPFI